MNAKRLHDQVTSLSAWIAKAAFKGVIAESAFGASGIDPILDPGSLSMPKFCYEVDSRREADLTTDSGNGKELGFTSALNIRQAGIQVRGRSNDKASMSGRLLCRPRPPIGVNGQRFGDRGAFDRKSDQETRSVAGDLEARTHGDFKQNDIDK